MDSWQLFELTHGIVDPAFFGQDQGIDNQTDNDVELDDIKSNDRLNNVHHNSHFGVTGIYELY